MSFALLLSHEWNGGLFTAEDKIDRGPFYTIISVTVNTRVDKVLHSSSRASTLNIKYKSEQEGSGHACTSVVFDSHITLNM